MEEETMDSTYRCMESYGTDMLIQKNLSRIQRQEFYVYTYSNVTSAYEIVYWRYWSGHSVLVLYTKE